MDEPIVVSRSVVLQDAKQRKCLAKRAYHRYQEARKKAKVVRWWNTDWWSSKRGDPPEKWVGQMAATHKHYPCAMCGNPRRWFGEITTKEKVADEWASAQLEEV